MGDDGGPSRCTRSCLQPIPYFAKQAGQIRPGQASQSKRSYAGQLFRWDNGSLLRLKYMYKAGRSEQETKRKGKETSLGGRSEP